MKQSLSIDRKPRQFVSKKSIKRPFDCNFSQNFSPSRFNRLSLIDNLQICLSRKKQKSGLKIHS